ncbi:hypothetical protein BDW68DRAFT_180046 [Aspergillus falconensis]
MKDADGKTNKPPSPQRSFDLLHHLENLNFGGRIGATISASSWSLAMRPGFSAKINGSLLQVEEPIFTSTVVMAGGELKTMTPIDRISNRQFDRHSLGDFRGLVAIRHHMAPTLLATFRGSNKSELTGESARIDLAREWKTMPSSGIFLASRSIV